MTRTVISKAAFSIAVLLLAALACARGAAASGDISHLFETGSITWMLQDASDNETDMFQWSLELEAGDLPVEVALERIRDAGGGKLKKINSRESGAAAPVLEAVKFIYPEDTPAKQRMRYVEIRARGATKEPFRTLYRGPVDPADPRPVIKVSPHVAESVRIRFLGADSEAPPVLPRLELQGVESVSGALPGAEPVTRSYVAFLGGEPVGRYTWERERIETGFIYRSKSFMQLKFYDEESGEETNKGFEQDCAFETADDLTITSMDCEYPEEDKWIQGDMEDGDFILDAEWVDKRNSQGLPRHINWKNGEAGKKVMEIFPKKLYPQYPLVHETMVYDFLAAQGLAHGMTRRMCIVHTDKGSVIDATARIVEFYPAREHRADLFVALVDGDDSEDGYTRVALIDSSGEVLREFNYGGNYEWWAVEDPEEWDLEPLIIDSEMMLAYLRDQLRNVIPLPDSVDRARMSITWNEVPPEFLDLEGPRQTVVSLNEPEPGVYEAELEVIRRLPGQEPLNPSGALSGAELAPYLLYDETIDIQSPKIAEKAEEIAGGETDPLEVSKRIFNWLVRNMKPEIVEEYHVPPASSIVKKLKGDCKHFAVLFAALARARGVPARFVFGQRYIGGSYGYHVWNQIYIDGEWLDVDASDLAFVPGAMHVQLDTAASFNEKGHSGALLGFRPDPEPLETEMGAPDYSALSGRVPTELADTHFQDAFFNFRITYPQHLAHEVIDLGFIRKISFTLPGESAFMANIYVLPFKGDLEGTLMSAGIGQQEMLHMLDLFGSFKSATMSKAGTTDFGGGQGIYLLGSFRNADGVQVKFDLTILPLDDRIFIFHYAATPEVFGHYNSHVGYIKKSLQTF